jgi:archaellum component FlaF (FlaF/FlaG flagellin family)
LDVAESKIMIIEALICKGTVYRTMSRCSLTITEFPIAYMSESYRLLGILPPIILL